MADPIRDMRLPLWRTVREAYVLTFRNFGAFLRIAWAWLVVLSALVALVSWFFWPSHAAALEAGELTSWVQVVTTTLSMAAGASIAVAWHTLLLKGARPAGPGYLRLDGVVWRYLLVGLAMVAPFYLLDFAIPSANIETEGEGGAFLFGILLTIPLFVVLIVLGTKLSPILPAIALGRGDVTLGAVWRATHWSWWRLFVGFLLTAVPPLLVVALPLLIKGWQAGDDALPETHSGFVLANTQIEIITLVSGIFAISFLSLAFRHFFPEVVREAAASDGSDASS